MVSTNNLGITNETKEMFKQRVNPIVEHFLSTDELFENLKRDEMVEVMVEAFSRNFSAKQLETMSDETLTAKIRSVLGLEALSHLFDDWTPEQIAEYEAAVKDVRRTW
jgi:hypothetical protein